MPPLITLSVAQPLLEELAVRPFEGRVLGCFEQALNLADEAGRVIAVTLPEVGQGPFSVIVAGSPHLFQAFSVGQPALADCCNLRVGNQSIDLSLAKIWEPRLNCPNQPLYLKETLISILKPYTIWPEPGEFNASLNKHLVQAATQLHQALIALESEKIIQAAGQLAGLGSGLTPAGDDYLLGAMAALWLIGFKELLPAIAGAAIPLTTTLSAAFLRAAAQGQFMEPWHTLAQALSNGETIAVREAAAQVAQFGASSGRDALAGFVFTLLNMTKPEQTG